MPPPSSAQAQATETNTDNTVYEEIDERVPTYADPAQTQPAHIYYGNEVFENEPKTETVADGRPIGNGIVRNGVVSFTTSDYEKRPRYKKNNPKGVNEHPKYGSPKTNNNNGDDDQVPVGMKNIHDTMY